MSLLIAFGLAALGLALASAAYRVFAHPLAAVPGPKLAAISSAYEVYYDLVEARLPWKLKELHDKYGPVVRISPNEVHINDPDFTTHLFSAASANRRDKYAPHQQQLGVPTATVSTIQADLHQRRREALAPFLSSLRIQSCQSTLLANTENIASRFERWRQSGAVVELRQLFWYMATDNVTEVAFPVGTNLLGGEDLDPGYYAFQKGGQGKLLWFKHFPFFWTLLKGIPPQWLLKMAPAATIALHWEIANKKLASSILSNSKTDGKWTVFHHLSESSLPPAEKHFDRIWDEATSLVGAGGETVANVLCTTIFYVLQDDSVAARLRDELKSAIPNAQNIPSLHALLALPYLSAVVQEGLRKAIGLTARFIRVDNKAVTTYRSYALPPGTAISVSALLSNNNPSIFPDPEKFKPERWLDAEKDGSLRTKRKQMITFGGGPRKCLGEHLAQAEIYLTLAIIFRRFDLKLYDTSAKDIEPMYDSMLPLQWEGSMGLRVRVQ